MTASQFFLIALVAFLIGIRLAAADRRRLTARRRLGHLPAALPVADRHWPAELPIDTTCTENRS